MKKIIILSLSLILILGGAFFIYNNLSAQYQPPAEHLQDGGNSDSSDNTGSEDITGENTSAEEIIPAADFTIYAEDGTSVNLSDFYGKPIVVNFWATWCGPCKMELPAFDSIYQEYKDDVHFLMVNLTDGIDETVEHVSAFVSENNYTFPVYYDTEMDAAITYYITSVPRTLFIDRDGNISYGYMGAMSEAMLRSYIEGMLE
uniref:TlpA family protein disulfide reductase n=1 Tax=Agathobacter sp. TaxID=2021311 RepID=UPI0040574BAA